MTYFNPKMTDTDFSDINSEYNVKSAIRYRNTLQWLKNFDICGPCLDLGHRTRLTELIESEFDLICDNYTNDLDYICINEFGKNCYENIFAFEVIEHVIDVLKIVIAMRNATKNKVYLSTPPARPNFIRSKDYHFHEFQPEQLIYLINKAGFKVVANAKIKTLPKNILYRGIRPWFRYFKWNTTTIFCLEKR